jgi:iron complex outermembrane recepter protein
MSLKTKTMRERLLASTVIVGALALATAGHAAAQATSASSTQGPVSTTQDSSAAPGTADAQSASPLSGTNGVSAGGSPTSVQEVVVTGSLFRRKLSDTDAPLTVLSSQDLNQRGITTVTNAIAQIADNGSSGLPNSFTAQGAFAAGASAVSLRGLTSAATLVVIDGLRTAYYPLADDATRNFVDLNTIPDIIVDRIETLKDGASSTYGADAVAGVVNVVTKKTYEGLTARAEGGWSEAGGGSTNNFQVLAGHGNLARDGYNIYIGAEYEHDADLYNNQRGYPFNTNNQGRNCGIANGDGVTPAGLYAAGTQVCAQSTVVNGLQFNGGLQTVSGTTVPIFRAVSNITGQPTGNYTLFPGTGCGNLTTTTYTAANLAAYGPTGVSPGTTLCQQDLLNQYGEILPDDRRLSISLRGTKQLGEHAQAYLTANFYQNTVLERGDPSTIRTQTTPGQLGQSYSTATSPGLTLPAVLPNGQLNPQDPFAALGEASTIRYRFGDIPEYGRQYDRTYRIATGVNGDFDLYGNWRYSVEATGTENYLNNTAGGDLYVANLLSAVANGTYNFLNPSANTQAIRNFVAPTSVQHNESKLYQLQGTLSRDLYQLPGGPLTLGLVGSVRYESIYNPSANPDVAGQPTDKYFTINPFGTIGSRYTEGVAFEVDAPIVKMLDVDVSGRYDTYSTGQSNFSPKIGGKFTPIKYVTFRSTYSQGFRIPNFAESNSLPSTGFVNPTAPQAFLNAHGNDGYGVGYSLGETTEGTQGLKPEKSENFTVGLVVDPIRELSFSMDFYRIKIRDVIQGNTSNLSNAIDAYYAGTPVPPGYTLIPSQIVDPNFPNAQPTLGFIEYGFVNEGVETTSGYDFGATANFRLPYGVHYTSSLDLNYVLELNLITPNGTQHYAGSLGPYNNVAAGGTPKVKGNWQNTLAYGPASLTMTAYFVDGYQEEAEDIGGVIGDCTGSTENTGVPNPYIDGTTPIQCKAKPFWDIDLHASYDVFKYLQLYVDVQNLFNKPAPYDPSAEYGATQYNSTFNNQGIIGRFFKVGMRATF